MNRRRLPIAAAALLLTATSPVTSPAWAQGIDLATGDPDSPIQVVADNGIEWQQENQLLIARGNARASRGGVTVAGDELRAYYQQKPSGGTDLTRLDAVGRVTIASANQLAKGKSATYDLRKAILVLFGPGVEFSAGGDVITASKQLEYWEKERRVVVRGNAVVRRQGRTLGADVLVAFLDRDRDGKLSVRRVQAFDNVVIKTDLDIVRADKGVYNLRSGIATLTGNVRIARGENILAGEIAEINLNTGISRLLTAPGAKSRVRGLLLPDRGRTKKKPAGR